MSADQIDARSGFFKVRKRRLEKFGEELDSHVTTGVEVNFPSFPAPAFHYIKQMKQGLIHCSSFLVKIFDAYSKISLHFPL